MAFDLGISKLEKLFFEKEKKMDVVLSENRKIVRACSNAIKAMHAREMDVAEQSLKEAQEGLDSLAAQGKEFTSHLDHVYQEYAEARIVLSAVKDQKIPKFDDLNVPAVPYLNGLLDAIGELKREMYEALRHKDKEGAERYFTMMENIYDALLPLRFSNSVLPEFRRKQDAARHQVEQARGELL